MHEALGFKPEKYLVIYDRKLASDPEFAQWIKGFKFTMPVKAGEELKDLSKLSDHVKKIFKLMSPFSTKGLCLIGIGGGSIGDFTGFVASILKRGVPLIHMPTTLLAAMDSAHGGKTALNLGEFKNQIGTFYPADAVIIVQSIFESLAKDQIQSASGELAKMALIEGGDLFKAVKKDFAPTIGSIFNLLPSAIDAKYRWVEKDPYEKQGERQVLNLGHSLGHVLEGYYKVPHGFAVGEGLIFAVRWSHHQGYLSAEQEADALALLEKLGFMNAPEFAKKYRALSKPKLFKMISEDKKLVDARHLTCVFLKGIGSPIRKKMTIESFVTETQRQGWTAL